MCSFHLAIDRLADVVEEAGALGDLDVASACRVMTRTVAALLTGGNIDPAMFSDIIQDRRQAA